MRKLNHAKKKMSLSKMVKFSLLAALLLSGIAIWVPQILGWNVRTVLTDSMAPNIKAGSLAFVKEANKASIQVGDILLYQASNQPIPTLHRVKNITKDAAGTSLELKGDSNENSDFMQVTLDQVQGKLVMSVSHVGYAIEYAQKHVLLIALFILFIFFSNQFSRGRAGAHHETA